MTTLAPGYSKTHERSDSSSKTLKRTKDIGQHKNSNCVYPHDQHVKKAKKKRLESSIPPTNLFIACQKGDLNTVRKLISENKQINVYDVSGDTPLHVASEEGHLQIVDFLIQNGASIDIPDDEFGATPLYIASQERHSQIVDFLIQNGASIDIPDESGATPLFIASYEGHLEIVDQLIKHGASIAMPHESGATPLYIASQENHLKIVELLINKGADINCVNESGATPLYIASQENHLKIVEFLINKGADINCVNEEDSDWVYPNKTKEDNEPEQTFNWTCLQNVCKMGHLDIVKLLLKHGVDASRKDKRGKSALDIARDFERQEIVDYLESCLLKSDSILIHTINRQCVNITICSTKDHVEFLRNENLASEILTFQNEKDDFCSELNLKNNLEQWSIGSHQFKSYSLEINSDIKNWIMVTSNDHDFKNETAMEIFQFLAFYQWDKIKTLLILIKDDNMKLPTMSDKKVFIENLFSHTVLFCFYGLSIDKVTIVFESESSMSNYAFECFAELKEMIKDLQENKQNEQLPLQFLYYGSKDREIIKKREDDIRSLLPKGCFFDMEHFVGDIQFQKEGSVLGFRMLKLMNEIKCSKLVMIYKSCDFDWTIEYELISLLGLVMARALDGNFVCMEPPLLNNYPKTVPVVGTENNSFTNSITKTCVTLDDALTKLQVTPTKSQCETQAEQRTNQHRESGDSGDSGDLGIITILYNRCEAEETEKATNLCRQLRGNGFRVLLLHEGEAINMDQHQDTQIVLQAIQRSQIIIALITPRFLYEQNYLPEFSLALWYHSARNKTLLSFVSSPQIVPDLENVMDVYKRESIFQFTEIGDDQFFSIAQINCIATRILTRGENLIVIHPNLMNRLLVFESEDWNNEVADNAGIIDNWVQNFAALHEEFPCPIPTNFANHENLLKIREIQFQDFD